MQSSSVHATRSTLTSWARAILAAMAAHGVDTSKALQQAGLDPALIHQAHARYPLAGMEKLWAWAYDGYGAGVGLAVAQHVQPANWQLLGLTFMASPTVAVALERLRRYSMLVSDAISVEHHVSGDRLSVQSRYLDEVSLAADRTEAFVATAFKFSRMLLPGLAPLRVELTRPEPEDSQPWRTAFQVPIVWQQPHVAVVLPREVLAEAVPSANSQLAREHDQILKEYLAQFAQEALVQRVRQSIIEQLPSGEPAIAHVAEDLLLSTRSLQRKLAEESTSFRALLDAIRSQLACDYLAGGEYGTAEITYLLGFSDQSNFSKAFKRWMGVTPRQYRQQVLH